MKNRADRVLDLRARLMRKRVIAGLRSVQDGKIAADRGVEVCFFLAGTLFELRDIVRVCHNHNQMAFAHVDLISGVAKDAVGMQFLAEEIGVDGILTTKNHLISAAKHQGLLAIQRLFMLDSEALRTGLKMLTNSQPDAVEILPALILPNVIKRLPGNMPPIIAGGLVENKKELDTILVPPVLAVSTSSIELWK